MKILIILILLLLYNSLGQTKSSVDKLSQLKEIFPKTKLLPFSTSGGDNFGYAISLDGNRAIIGAPFDSNNGTDKGAVYIFDFKNGQWTSPIKLFASDLSINFGSSVHLNGDNIIITAKTINSNAGKIYIFNFDGFSWVEKANIEIESISTSVSILGNRAIVGAPYGNNNGVTTGTVYVYELISSNWQLVSTINPYNTFEYEEFGFAVSLGVDRILVGSPYKYDHVNNISGAGGAYIYDLVFNGLNNIWLETKLHVPELNHNSLLGQSVDLVGNMAVVGAPGKDGQIGFEGAAYIFNYDLTWSPVKLLASDGSTADLFGRSVSLGNNRVLIGAFLDDDLNNKDVNTNSGAAYQFDYNGAIWIETKKYLANDAASADYYGFSVSLSGDNALIGAYKDDDGGTDSGSVYTFNIEFIFSDGFE